MRIKKLSCLLIIVSIIMITALSTMVSADSAGLPMRIYYDSNVFRTYISGEFTPSYPANGGYGTTNGKHISQIFVQAYENAWPNTQAQKGTIPNNSVSSTNRMYTYYNCDYFTNGSRTINTSNKTDSAECTFYGVGQLLQGYSTRYKVFCLSY
ncbi:MAG: hypothetical protein ACI4JI_04075 [Ruminiclostridium sp.]